MNNFENMLEKYALLTVKVGVNIQKKQTLVINAPIECYEFVRKVTKLAYLNGAKDVFVEWNDEEIALIKYLHAPDEAFKEFPMWKAKGLEELAKNNAAFLSISASNPELLKNVNPDRIAENTKSRSIALKEYKKYIMNSSVSWCVVSVPTKEWAKKVFPTIKEDEAILKLWESIFKIIKADKEDILKEWNNHLDNINNKVKFLNSKKFRFLKYKSSTCDLSIELPNNHIWCGGGEFNEKNTYFVANMPTEEVFTLPLKTGVNGYVKNTKPFNYGGNLIDNFTLTFKEGKIIDFSAKIGYDTLKNIIQTDEGSQYLGEIALVPYDSPISNSNIVFYNTLFDENASSHLAIGSAYPICLENGSTLKDEELEKSGANISLIHEDFMIGSKDLVITGKTFNGEEVQIFKDGNWAF